MYKCKAHDLLYYTFNLNNMFNVYTLYNIIYFMTLLRILLLHLYLPRYLYRLYII